LHAAMGFHCLGNWICHTHSMSNREAEVGLASAAVGAIL